MIRCSQCGREYDQPAVISISGRIMGDDYIESYYLCPFCDFYTVEIARDRFLGVAETSVRGPITRSEGDAIVERIRQCSEPQNKSCQCNVHQQYFRGDLD